MMPSLPSNALADFKNPFSVECIETVRTYFYRHCTNNVWQFTGAIEFKNGNTKGEQNFKGNSAEEVYAQMRAFAAGLKSK